MEGEKSGDQFTPVAPVLPVLPVGVVVAGTTSSTAVVMLLISALLKVVLPSVTKKSSAKSKGSVLGVVSVAATKLGLPSKSVLVGKGSLPKATKAALIWVITAVTAAVN